MSLEGKMSNVGGLPFAVVIRKDFPVVIRKDFFFTVVVLRR